MAAGAENRAVQAQPRVRAPQLAASFNFHCAGEPSPTTTAPSGLRRRVPGSADSRDGGPRQPVARVHVDHTEKSGPQRVRDLIPEEAETLLQGRVQIINLWRPIRGPLLDSPLAVCDARTVKPGELVGSDLVYPNRVGETYSVKYNPDHQWFYVPGMTADEILLLKCFDSRTDGRARFAPHSAFVDPTTPADALPRESIELRTLVFHNS
jgi:hypothetical protein